MKNKNLTDQLIAKVTMTVLLVMTILFAGLSFGQTLSGSAGAISIYGTGEGGTGGGSGGGGLFGDSSCSLPADASLPECADPTAQTASNNPGGGGASQPGGGGGGGGGGAAQPEQTVSNACIAKQSIGGNCTDNGPLANHVASRVVNILSVLVGVLAVIFIIIAGFKYITSGGSQEKVAAAKQALLYAVIGIAVAALAQLIVRIALSFTAKV